MILKLFFFNIANEYSLYSSACIPTIFRVTLYSRKTIKKIKKKKTINSNAKKREIAITVGKKNYPENHDETGAHHRGQRVVDDVHLLGEPVQHPPQRGRVEQLHRPAQHVAEQDHVHLVGRFERPERKRDRRRERGQHLSGGGGDLF